MKKALSETTALFRFKEFARGGALAAEDGVESKFWKT